MTYDDALKHLLETARNILLGMEYAKKLIEIIHATPPDGEVDVKGLGIPETFADYVKRMEQEMKGG